MDPALVKKYFQESMQQVMTTGKVNRTIVHTFGALDPQKQDLASRILICKFFTLYTQIKDIKDNSAAYLPSPVPAAEDIEKCRRWIDFPVTPELTDEQIGEAINLRFKLACIEQDVEKIEALFTEVKGYRPPKAVKSDTTTYYWQRLFQMACMLGFWDDVIKYGKQVACFSEIRGNQRVPMMQRYHIEAQKSPHRFLNYLEIFKSANDFKEAMTSRFNHNLNAPLQFTSLPILSFETRLNSYTGVEAKTIDEKQKSWSDRYAGASGGGQGVAQELRRIWIFGANVQLMCPTKQMALLSGPFNDSFMKASGRATYAQRAPPPPEEQAAATAASEPRLMTMKMEILLELEKKEPTTVNGQKGWLWEGTLEVPRYRAVPSAAGATGVPTITWSMLFNETYDVRMVCP